MITNVIYRKLNKNKKFNKNLSLWFRKGFLSDKLFLSIKYRLKVGRKLNWDDPKSMREKWQWLKLYDRRPEYTIMVDKYRFKEWAANIIGEEYIIPLLGVWDRPEDVDFSILPKKFVLKCNHSTAHHYIHSGDDEPDREFAVGLLKKSYDIDHFWKSAEWPYKNVEKKVIAEEYIEDPLNPRLVDYKYYCYWGVPHYIQVNSHAKHEYFSDQREVRNYQGFYDMDWNMQEFTQEFPYEHDVYTPKPANFDKMTELAKKLSQGIPFVRVDFYNISGKIYAGEMTLYPYAGLGAITPEKWDFVLGDLLDLSPLKR